MYKLDELVKLERSLETPIITKANIALASLDKNVLKDLCREVLRLLCKYDPNFDNLYSEHFLVSLFGIHDGENDHYYNHYINNISDDMIKILYEEEHENIVSAFIDAIAFNFHDLIVFNIGGEEFTQEIAGLDDLVYKLYKAYESASMKDADIEHKDNISESLKNIVLHSEEKPRIPTPEELGISKTSIINDLQAKINNVKGIIQSIIQAVPYGNTLLVIPQGEDRMVYYAKSEIYGYIEVTTFLKANSDKLVMDIKEGTNRIPIPEFIELLPTLGL